MAYEKSSGSSGRHRLGSLLDTSPIDMSKPAKPATDGALGGVISALAGNGSLASKGAAIGGLFGGVGSAVGGGLGLVADIFGSMGDSQDDKDRKAQESMNQLRSSLQDWYTLE